MSSIIDYFDFNIVALSLTLSGLSLVTYRFYTHRRNNISTISSSDMELFGRKVSNIGDDIFDLLKSGEHVEFRLIQELYESEYFFNPSLPIESKKIFILNEVIYDLKCMLKKLIKTKEDYSLKDKIFNLIDEAEKRYNSLMEKEPFEGLEDPERSLFIDVLEIIPAEENVYRQKLIQVADIVKLKHQDIKKLQVENNKSSDMSRFGFYSSIFFGIISIALSFYGFFSSSPN